MARVLANCGDTACTRVVSKVTRSVSEGGKARPRLRFGLLGWDQKHLSSSRVGYNCSQYHDHDHFQNHFRTDIRPEFPARGAFQTWLLIG
jgi:hypothetical protein